MRGEEDLVRAGPPGGLPRLSFGVFDRNPISRLEVVQLVDCCCGQRVLHLLVEL